MLSNNNKRYLFTALNKFREHHPYFVEITLSPIVSINVKEDEISPIPFFNTFCCLSPSYQIIINEHILNKIDSDKNKVLLLLFSIIKLNYHFVLDHQERGRNKHPILWQLACNLSIYSILQHEFSFLGSEFKSSVDFLNSLGFGIIDPALLKLPEKMAAEEYYQELVKMMEDSKMDILDEHEIDKDNNKCNSDKKNGDGDDNDDDGGLDSDENNSGSNENNKNDNKRCDKSNKGNSKDKSNEDNNEAENENKENDKNLNDKSGNNKDNNCKSEGNDSSDDNSENESNDQNSDSSNYEKAIKSEKISTYKLRLSGTKSKNMILSKHMYLMDNSNVEKCMNKELSKSVFYNCYYKKALLPGLESSELKEFVSKLEVRDKFPKLFDTFSAFREKIQKRTFSKPKKRLGTISKFLQGVVLPGRKYVGTKVGVIIDSSGSMSNNQLRCALGIVNLRVQSKDDITVYVIDTEIHQKFKVHKMIDEIEIKGRGGTDIIPAFNECVKDKNDRILILSDGFVSAWPDKVSIPTIFCFIPPPEMNKDEIRKFLETVPDWIHKCVFDDHLA